MIKKLFAIVSVMIVLLPSSPVYAQDPLRADSVNAFFDPDLPLPAGQTFKSYYEARKFRFLYREIIPTAVSSDTYFMIAGANSGFPDFYGGIQQYKDGTQYAIFSAWDVNSDGTCWTCLPGTAAPEKQVSVWAKGDRTTTRPFGYEGTGMNSMIPNFEWKVGEKIAMLAAIDPAGKGSLISAAFKVGNKPWEFITSFYVPTRYDIGMSGGYSFVENWVGGNENSERSYLVGPAILEDEDGKQEVFTNVYIGANNPTGDKIPNEHSIAVEGSWVRIKSGIGLQANAKAEYRVQIAKPLSIPNYDEGKALIDKYVYGKSTRQEERAVRLEAIAKAKAEAEAEAKAKAEAEAKAKAEAEAKAKVDAEAAAAKKRITIRCVKGKTVKKVTAVNPKCPSGYKKK
ncbi:MAG: hypothetical protein RLZZ159_1277 [Actinomycetota bacterium]|jgi:hypothetical protein